MTTQTSPCNLKIGGEFNVFTALAVREQLLAALDGADEIEVDLSEVGEFDSAGLQLMVSAKREAAERGKVLRFCHHSAAVVDLLDLADLSAYFGDPVLLPSRNRS